MWHSYAIKNNITTINIYVKRLNICVFDLLLKKSFKYSTFNNLQHLDIKKNTFRVRCSNKALLSTNGHIAPSSHINTNNMLFYKCLSMSWQKKPCCMSKTPFKLYLYQYLNHMYISKSCIFLCTTKTQAMLVIDIIFLLYLHNVNFTRWPKYLAILYSFIDKWNLNKCVYLQIKMSYIFTM